MAIRDLAPRLYEQFARIGQALSNPQRVRILSLLCHSERSVDDLAAELGQSSANTSAHLKVLREAYLVATRRQGQRVYCSLASESVVGLWMALRDFGLEQLPEARELMREEADEHGQLEPVVAEELLRLARAGEIVLLDLRPAREFEAGHLPLARSVPFEELDERMEQLPRDRPIVVYRRGPFCVGAIEAVERLRAAGFRASRLRDGVTEWRAVGRALEGKKGTVQ